MNKNITVKPNQSMEDVVIQGTGSIEAGMQFCLDNNVSLSDIPDVGSIYKISDPALATGDKGTLNYLDQNGIIIGTLGIAPPVNLGFRVALYPIMRAVKNPADAGTHPDILGYWDFILKGFDTEFVSVYGFGADNYFSHPNPVGYLCESAVLSGGIPGIKNSETPALMSDWNVGVYWHIPFNGLTSGGPYVVVQSAEFIDGSAHTLLFKDMHGNEATVSPFIVLEGHSQGVVDSLTGHIFIDLVSSDTITATIRVRRLHVSTASPDWGTINLFFIDEATGGIPDPDDPANPDKTIVTIGPGAHTFGVLAQYVYSDGITTLGYSMIEMVVEV
jgi:hypothetical protein